MLKNFRKPSPVAETSFRSASSFVISGVLFAAASLFSDNTFFADVLGREHLPAVFTFAAGALLVYAMRRNERIVRGLFLWGLAFHILAFYWLADTLTLFGGFPKPVAIPLYLLYAVVSSLQLVLCGLIARRIALRVPEYLGIAFPLAWCVCDFLVPRLFPWSFVHPLIGWKHFALLASYAGEAPLCFLLFWAIEMLFRLPRAKVRADRFVLLVFLAVCGGSAWLAVKRDAEVSAALAGAEKLRVALVQGNLSTKEKGDIQMLTANVDRYRTLSRSAIERGAELVIWPESVVNVWTPEGVQGVRGTKLDPFPDNAVPLLYGGLSFRPRPPEEVERLAGQAGGTGRESFFYKKYNTAFGIDTNGVILGRYHKRVLMPFGEYLPFSETFPSVRSLSPHSGDFTSGDLLEPVTFPRGEGSYRVGALICYEDLVPALARDAVSRGADVLVNLTNDAWYGITAAPYQHHLLASWRAIESGRALIRSTNTGVTAIVEPDGRTTAVLPIFTEGVIEREVPLVKGETFFLRHGDIVSYLLCALAAVLLLLRKPIRA